MNNNKLGVMVLAVAMCGGAGCGDSSSDGGSDGASSGDGASAADFEGTWVSGVCSSDGAGRAITIALAVTKTSDNSISFTENLAVAPTAECKNAVIDPNAAPSSLGSVVFEPGESADGIDFARGTWTIPSGMTSRTIWAFKTKDVICQLGDTEPTILPDGSDVAGYVEILDPKTCYGRLGTR